MRTAEQLSDATLSLLLIVGYNAIPPPVLKKCDTLIWDDIVGSAKMENHYKVQLGTTRCKSLWKKFKTKRLTFKWFKHARIQKVLSEGSNFNFLLLFSFFYEGRKDSNTTISGLSRARQRNAIQMAFCWWADGGPTVNAGL